MTKPMLASDADEKKIRYPVLAQPKIDGVRSLNIAGKLTGRSLKQHANRYVTSIFSDPLLSGFDGEMAAEADNHPDLCRLTTSALNTIAGEPFIVWWLFDYVTPHTRHLSYVNRYAELKAHVNILRAACHPLSDQLRVVPLYLVHNHDELLKLDDYWLEQGYEGTILRDPEGKHKDGRSTVREGGLLRIKRFVEEDAVVVRVVEGQHNQNEAKRNELGHIERSTNRENMVPNGLVGTLICRDVKTGAEIEVAPGKMTHSDRELYLSKQDLIVGRTIKYKHFPKGVKDKPRFPTFQAFRILSDEAL